MNKKRVQGFVAATLMATALWSGSPVQAAGGIGYEEKLSPEMPSPTQAGIDISTDYAVWINEDDDDQGIVVYDMDNGTSFVVAANGKDKLLPKVDGKYVVWIDTRHDSQGDIYLYDIDKKQEKRLTTDAAVPSQLALEGKYVVWTDKRGGKSDIYAYDITAGTEKKLTASGVASSPDIDRSLVVYEDTRHGDSDIFTYDLSTNTENKIVSSKKIQKHPSIDGDTIAYEDNQYDGYYEISTYDLRTKREKRLTNGADRPTNPRVSGGYVIFEEDDSLQFMEVGETYVETIERDYYKKIVHAADGYNVFYTTYEDGETTGHIYDIDEEEEVSFGAEADNPSLPAASDRYVVYVTEVDRSDVIMLMDLASNQAKIISNPDHDSSRPVVTDSWAAFYDDSEDVLYAYEIKTGKLKAVSEEDEDVPVEEKYEIDKGNLVWLNKQGRNYVVTLTGLSRLTHQEIASVRSEPHSVDVYGNLVSYVEDSGDEGELNLYDYTTETLEYQRDGVIENAQIGDDYLVWSEKTEETQTWDLYYYNIASNRAFPLFKRATGDQVRPQVSRGMLVFEDNRRTDPGEYEYQAYDLEEMKYSYSMSGEAVATQANLGGNRLVWVDEREKGEPVLYTMEVGEARDDDDSTVPPDVGEYKEYVFEDLIADDSFFDIVNDTDPEKVVFVFYADTDDEVSYDLTEIEDIIELIVDVPADEVLVRIYE
ncbi:TolB family protein [Brevibacillus dissolubilis]|uniref:TolB family protein n=1 Tax=Brevibacillus dissolubilis TaxID=1844116 RepID=UPI001115CBEB|nr:hypothetical protein [Brevibacillus dissolubilis]